jgi:mono/diheme cytochrome c family protein
MNVKKTFALALSTPLAIALAATLAGGTAGARAAEAPKVLDGKQIFLAQKCNLCHSISSAGIVATTKSEKLKGPDLAGAAAKRDAGLLNNYLRKKVEINGQKHSKEFTGSDDEIGALIGWLQKQEKK